MLRTIAKALFVSRAWILSIACLAAIGAAIGVVVEIFHPFQECVKEIYYNPATESFVKSISSFSVAFDVYRGCLGHFTHDNAEAIIAAFTIILALSTIFLWFATRDLVRATEKTAKAQLRAYVGVTTYTQVPNLAAGQKQVAVVFFTNYGLTPANKTHYWGEVQIREYPLIAPLPSLDFRSDILPINPSQKIPIAFETINQLTVEEETKIRTGTSRFYLYGEIEYFDVFGESRSTTFRFSYGGDLLVGLGVYTVDEEGNDAE